MTTQLEMLALPEWPRGTLFVGVHQWAILGATLAQLHDDHEQVVGQFVSLEAFLMSSVADLNAQLDAIRASQTAEAASLVTLGTALTTIIADLQALPPVGVMTQADLDAVVQKATDDATAAAANAATSATQSTQAGAAVPPSPAA